MEVRLGKKLAIWQTEQVVAWDTTSCRGLMLLGAVERRGAFVVGIREVILEICGASELTKCGIFDVAEEQSKVWATRARDPFDVYLSF